MKKYNLINNIFGWLSFAIAAVVYCMTIEPSASFWDCGEFITSAYKLEVGHPPGAPFFMLTGKFFSLFASDPSQVAAMVNIMSALLSALTILFLFWTITHLAKKLVCQDNNKEMSLAQLIIIMGSGLVGALVYTFSDTFWFSAVEGEVYAYSSMFTALVFWLILKWENRAGKPGADKWLVLIAYAMGLSIGVHLLNLLCIPAIVLVYYFKKSNAVSTKGILLSLLGSFGLIVVLMYGIIPGFSKLGGWFELFFVNSLGFSYNSGAFAYLILLFVTLAWAGFETFSAKGSMSRAKIAFLLCAVLSGTIFIGSSVLFWLVLLAGLIVFLYKYKGVTFRLLNTSVLCLFVIMIGYSSFALIPIRSAANTPMDQNSPEDVFSLGSYQNREQYGDTPLFYGRTYASEVVRENGVAKQTNVKDKYGRVVKTSPAEKDRYVVTETSGDYEYTNAMLFPRMHASKDQPGYDRYMRGYASWGGVTSPSVTPTFFQNLQFFFSYQLNFMYFRYFMWNFSGRQNDIQSMGGISNGNWITGIGFIDEHILGLGSQDNLPPDIANNKGHNKFYMLPLILGILGIAFQLMSGKKGSQQLWVTFMLFFMTGIAIVIYLNQKPFEPRERDYAYAGSFYAFSIWIGLGVAGVWTLIKKYLKSETPAVAIIISVLTLLIPVQMVSQTWDDHDRSGRYIMHDAAMNYLDSCEEQGIIFTNGDNDTFPLWYIQEVEGYRTDVRVCNLSYLQTDWYVDQMRRQAYNSKPLPIDWEEKHYATEKGRYAFVMSKNFIEKTLQNQMGIDPNNPMSAMQAVDFTKYYDTSVFKDSVLLDEVMDNLRDAEIFYTPQNPFITDAPVIPGSALYMNVNEGKVNWANLGTQPKRDMVVNIGREGSAIYRSELMILDMLKNINADNWKRPVYFAVTVGNDMYMGLQKENFMLQGLTYRVVPGQIPQNGVQGGVNTDVTYNNMMNKFRYTGINNPKVYIDETNMRTCKTYRLMFAQLITALIEEGKNDKALKALDKIMEVVPASTVPMGYESVTFVDSYLHLGQKAKANAVAKSITDRVYSTLGWYHGLKQSHMNKCSSDIGEYINVMLMLSSAYQRNGEQKTYEELVSKLITYSQIYYSNGMIDLADFTLKNITNNAISNYYRSQGDTAIAAFENKILEKSMGMMQKYNPALLQEFQK
ncbi:hypothetical protein M2132_001209 [Dysgonomonas sp. PH5-45]|uniref:glycosyltransferase family 117 protein n=1 Tax=unclassified Dysgonomonas TaxID=2630389 RepID=UPI002475F5A0|nr:MULTISPECIES: DUF2723 domain-containing protein [unclassified Dysgonomonas]MDH6354876.1 hypothetical protein [Dysgonomonas sp. PH5-45]MDH6387775.1 hypothetical protein [Dysgonomonas sp. PH5-37]